MLKQPQLKKILMPLGSLTKKEVRRIAREQGLPAANGRESQEICFIPDNNYAGFLKQYIPEGPRLGPILDKKGEIVGEHRGICLYTIGQRRGIGIAAKHPLYVNAIDRKKNTIRVGKRKELYRKELVAKNISFIYMKELTAPLRVRVKVRYQHPAASATIIPESRKRVKVKFNHSQCAVTPGQAVVFFNRNTVIGGGTISSN
jgi:tRNA-specific 2-thiouridylase